MQAQHAELAPRAERAVADVVIVGGGQSGLAAAYAAGRAGLRPLVLEAGPEPVGSWPHYYDSLALFSPARFSALPGRPFPGDGERYPTRDEVVAYLRASRQTSMPTSAVISASRRSTGARTAAWSRGRRRAWKSRAGW